MFRPHNSRAKNLQRNIGVFVVLIIASFGVHVLNSSHAASPYVSAEAETGIVSSAAQSLTDTTGIASGGRYVQFGELVTTTTAGLSTPDACPSGSVTVTPTSVPSFQANTNYCFASGSYAKFSITPLSGEGFYGGEKAILDGGNTLNSAFSTSTTLTNVVIDGFTIQNYYNSSNNQVPGVIEFQNGSNITVSNNTIENDRTTAVSWGGNTGAACCVIHNAGVSNGTITHNVVSNIGYSGTVVASGTDDTISYNDISGTNNDGANPEIDVTALGKFAVDDGAQVIGNYVHNNNAAAIWFDDYNTNSTIKNNIIGPSNLDGIFYQLSFNAVISGNTIIDNGASDAGNGISAPGAGIRISSSGSSLDPPSPSSSLDGPQSITISNNTLTGNHEGITLYAGQKSIATNNVHVTGNTTTGDTSSIGTDGDAWLAYLQDPSGEGNTFSANNYIANPTNIIFSDPGTTTWAGWKAEGLDNSGSSCKTTSGGSC